MFSCPLRGKRKVRSRGKRASQGRISGWLSYLKIGQPGIFISVYQVISVNSFALPAVKIPLARSRAPERLPKKEFALFEAQPSLQTPGSIEEHPMRGINSGYPAFGGTKDTGGLFFGSFLWASKEMNRRTKRIPLVAEIAW
jgi:hypothetical protein